ncbi:MAG TPA: caspase family protein [Candidatus Limnocylindrales bacterium]|nr:caspase family protein [Candidatus Limnocylindrales bacterium]
MAEKRSALIVATSEYEDARLTPLGGPGQDAEALQAVLGSADIGGFDVQLALNARRGDLQTTLDAFFADRGRDDLLLVHFSGHGLKDDDGQLYFAAADTRIDRLMSTAIEAAWVNRLMTKCRSEKIALFLDCCFGGAFTAGLTRRAGVDTAGANETFGGTGRFVITASDAMQYSFESGERIGDGTPQPSPFTGALVEGLRSGEADRNEDGFVSINELYDYLEDRVRQLSPSQTPTKSAFNQVGDWVIAQSMRAPTIRILPASVQAQLKSEDALDRFAALIDLRDLIEGSDPRVSEAAMKALEKLTGDDSRRVSAAASRLFGELPAERGPGVVIAKPLSQSDVPQPIKDALFAQAAASAPAASPHEAVAAPAPGPAPAPAPAPAASAPAAPPASAQPAAAPAAPPARAAAPPATPAAPPVAPPVAPPAASKPASGALWGASAATQPSAPSSPMPVAAPAFAGPAASTHAAQAAAPAGWAAPAVRASAATTAGATAPPWSIARAFGRGALGMFFGLVLAEGYYVSTSGDSYGVAGELGAFAVVAAIFGGILAFVERVVSPLRIPGGAAYRLVRHNRWVVSGVIGFALGLVLAGLTDDAMYAALGMLGFLGAEALVGMRGGGAKASA